MAFIDRIRELNNGGSIDRVPFLIGGLQRGWVAPDMAARLARARDVFTYENSTIALAEPLLVATLAKRSERVGAVLADLHDAGYIVGWRDELYAIGPGLYAPAELLIERAAVPLFGVGGHGVHMNGYVRDGEELHMWVARRSDTKPTWPGLLDQLVAGGQPAGMGVRENLIKECGEEADISPRLAETAKSVGAISYCMDTPEGLRPDKIFVFDLELPSAFVPKNTDGEVAAFELWPLERVAETVRDTQAFKPNCALVALDFLIRHGFVGPEEPDYIELCAGLRSS